MLSHLNRARTILTASKGNCLSVTFLIHRSNAAWI